jgi:hypothetical protein
LEQAQIIEEFGHGFYGKLQKPDFAETKPCSSWFYSMRGSEEIAASFPSTIRLLGVMRNWG